MLQKGMIVRCPIDKENPKIPREFATGKIEKLDDFSEMVYVNFYDVNGVSAYHGKPAPINIMSNKLRRIKIRDGATVKYDNEEMFVCASATKSDEQFYYYYLKNKKGQVVCVCEKDITVSFNDGQVDPISQLSLYEFHNPCWFVGRSIVNRTINYIDHSLYGFKELAGCKIYLKPHQLRTVIRCLQTNECRYMLADEVGLGKTIEALSVLKIYIGENNNKSILIVVPDALVAQWKNELAFKFKLFEGYNVGNNLIRIMSLSEAINNSCCVYDFVIIDEVHRCLKNDETYNYVLNISKAAKNILMLSATPLQKREEDFLRLLCLIQPHKYENMDKLLFKKHMEQQYKIIRKTFNVWDELTTLLEILKGTGGNKNDDTEEVFEALIDELKGVAKIIQDNKFDQLIKSIECSDQDCGIAAVQDALAYVCENYQLEKSIIRNRRHKTALNDNDVHAQRTIIDLSYEANNENDMDEWNAYIAFSNWVEDKNKGGLSFPKDIIPTINSLFSSAKAFNSMLTKLKEKTNIPEELLSLSERYVQAEAHSINNIINARGSNKIGNIIDFVEEHCFDKKMILFTNFSETFNLYKKILLDVLGDDKCCFFSKEMDKDDLELNVYRFQTQESRSILLSDETGGEGRNFQNVDYLIHIDIPWNPNDIEQRIGRLDRIGRSPDKDIVSVVAYGKDTLEYDLFNIWHERLQLFTKAQSGLEIIMGDIETKIISCLEESFKYGLIQAQAELGALIKEQLETLKKEQVYDIAAYQFKSINRMLEGTIEKHAKNETRLFGDAMMSWAHLSGFNGQEDGEETVLFTQNSISIRSLNNTLFMPPEMKTIIDNKLNQLRNRVRVLNKEKIKNATTAYIRGTFNRQKAIANDYLNFFAPGDDIFDAITNNAIGFYKGTCSAFACEANINWEGLIFVWKLTPNKQLMYKKCINEHLINQYRGYLPADQIITSYELSETNEDNGKVVREFLNLTSRLNNGCLKNLGRREGANPPLVPFLKKYHPARWRELVKTAYMESKERANNIAEKRQEQLLADLKNELNMNYSAQKASAVYFNNNIDVNAIKEQNAEIFDVIRQANLVLDSVCYVEMKHD